MEVALIIALGVICTAIPFALGQRYGLVRLLSPMHLLAYFCLFGFAIKAVVYTFAPQLAFYRRYVDNPWGDLLGALYLSLFILLMCLGYRLACVPSCRSDTITAAHTMANGITRRGPLCLLAFGVTFLTALTLVHARGASLDFGLISGANSAKQINVDASGVGSTFAGLKTFFIVPKFAFVLLLAHGLAASSRAALAQAAVLGAMLLGVALISGDRFELIEMLVFALATHMILGGRISPRAAICLLLFGVIVVVVSAYMTGLRFGHGTGLAGLWLQIVGSTYFLDLNAAVMVTDRVSPSALLLGESYLWWTFGWVPRAIWIDKPAIDLGVFFKREVMEVYSGGAFNVTGPGEAFINFSWAGIGVGFALGWVYRKGEALLLAPLPTVRFGTFLLYPILFYPFIQATLQSSFSSFIVGAAAQAVLIGLMIAVFIPRYAVRTGRHPQDRKYLYVA